jgi:hypothetical protein
MKGVIRAYANEEFEKLVDYIRVKYKLRKFPCTLSVSFDNRRLFCWGGRNNQGKPFISLALDYESCKLASLKGAEIDLFEYEDYEHHPVIGKTPTTNWRYYVFRMVAHELAHTVEFHPMRIEKRLKYHTKASIKDLPKSEHGLMFQEIYVDLMHNWQDN